MADGWGRNTWGSGSWGEGVDQTVYLGGWGRAGWGELAFGTDSISVQGTAAVGSVVVEALLGRLARGSGTGIATICCDAQLFRRWGRQVGHLGGPMAFQSGGYRLVKSGRRLGIRHRRPRYYGSR
jgi:hypothetical protein